MRVVDELFPQLTRIVVYGNGATLGAAVDADATAAVGRAFGEAWERAAFAGHWEFAFADSGGRHRPPIDHRATASAEAPSESAGPVPDNSGGRHWMEGVDAASGQPVLVPGDLVLGSAAPPGDTVRPGTSAGTALATTYGEAAGSAVLELIEHDVLTAAVADGFAAQPVTMPEPWEGGLRTAVESSGYILDLWHLPTPHAVVVAIAVLVNRRQLAGLPAVVVGSAASTPLAAARRAVLEAIHTTGLARQVLERGILARGTTPPGAYERSAWWAADAAITAYETVVANATARPPVRYTEDGPLPDSRGLAASLLVHGHQVALIDITPRPLRHDARVVRAVSTTLRVLAADQRFPSAAPTGDPMIAGFPHFFV